jgi:anti-sigma factor RsiW
MDDLIIEKDHVSTLAMSMALDGLLSAAEAAAFQEHLQACSQCQVRWNRWQRISHALLSEPFVGPAPGFALRVDARIRQRHQQRHQLLGGLVVVGGTVSIGVLLLLGLVLTMTITLLASPVARLQAAEFLVFAGQLAALFVTNLSGARDAVLELVPLPGLWLVGGVCLLVLATLWAWLMSVGDRRATGMQAPATPSLHNGGVIHSDRVSADRP